MVNIIDQYVELVAGWSATLLLVAGVLWSVEAAAMLARELGVTVPNPVIILTAVPAMMLVLLGALGFYPGVAEETPRLAVAAAALAGLALVAFLVQLAWLLAANLLDAPNPHILVLAGTLLATAGSLALFAAGSAIAGTPSRIVGGLLVGFMLVWALWFVDFFVGVVPDPLDVGFHLLFAATVLAAGYAHRNAAALDAAGSHDRAGDLSP